MSDNKLIAEFMGCTNSFNDITDATLYKIEQGTFEMGELKYHTSWDWLMPVVIECFEIFGDSNTINYMKLNDALLTCNINEVYKVVVEFIKEYNNEN